MVYFIGVLVIWFLIRLYCRTVTVDHVSQPYELNRVYLDPFDSGGDAKKGYGFIRPEDEWSIGEDEVRQVLKESRELSKLSS